jgi:hypothetical protein
MSCETAPVYRHSDRACAAKSLDRQGSYYRSARAVSLPVDRLLGTRHRPRAEFSNSNGVPISGHRNKGCPHAGEQTLNIGSYKKRAASVGGPLYAKSSFSWPPCYPITPKSIPRLSISASRLAACFSARVSIVPFPNRQASARIVSLSPPNKRSLCRGAPR